MAVDSRSVSVAAVVVAWRAGERAGACLARLADVAPGARRILVDNEAGDGTGVDAPDGTVVLRLTDNRGFAGGANAGLTLAFEDGRDARRPAQRRPARRAGLRRGARRGRRRRRRGLAPHRRPARRGLRRRRARAAAGLRASRRRGARLPQRRVPVHLARRLGTGRAVRRGALPVLRGRRVEPARPRARRAAHGRARRARLAQRRRLERRRAGRDLGLLLDAQPAVAAGAAAGDARSAPRGRAHERARAACEPCARRAAASHAPSLRACATGPSIAWDVARGRSEGRVRRRLPGADARRHRAARDRPARRAARARRRRADRARPARVAGARIARPEARRAAAGSALVRPAPRQGGARGRGGRPPLPDVPRAAARGRPADGRHGARPRRAARAVLVPGLEPHLRPRADAARRAQRRSRDLRLARDRARRRRACWTCRTASCA